MYTSSANPIWNSRHAHTGLSGLFVGLLRSIPCSYECWCPSARQMLRSRWNTTKSSEKHFRSMRFDRRRNWNSDPAAMKNYARCISRILSIWTTWHQQPSWTCTTRLMPSICILFNRLSYMLLFTGDSHRSSATRSTNDVDCNQIKNAVYPCRWLKCAQ